MAKPVQIDISHARLVSVRGSLDQLMPILPLLMPAERRFVAEGPRGFRCLEGYATLFVTPGGRGCIQISAGHVEKVSASLRALGQTVEVIDRRDAPPPQLQPDESFLGIANRVQLPFLEAVSGKLRGQVRVRNHSDLIFAIANLAVLFPAANILIQTANCSSAWHLWQGLREHLNEPVQLAKGKWFVRHRIVICVFTRVVSPQHWHLILLPDTEPLGSPRIRDLVLSGVHGRTRVYAFPRADHRPTVVQQTATEALSGPQIFSFVPPVARVKVLLLIVDLPARAVKAGGLELKRAKVWHNERRNQVIATIATAAANGDLPTLWEHGLLLNDSPETAVDAAWRVAVLVESTEHGSQLQEHLSGWQLRSQLPDCTVVDNDGASLGGSIITAASAAMHGTNANFIIRADTGRAGPMIQSFPPPRQTADTILLVDVVDLGESNGRKQAQSRLAQYLNLGWEVEGNQAALRAIQTAQDQQPPRRRDHRPGSRAKVSCKSSDDRQPTSPRYGRPRTARRQSGVRSTSLASSQSDSLAGKKTIPAKESSWPAGPPLLLNAIPPRVVPDSEGIPSGETLPDVVMDSQQVPSHPRSDSHGGTEVTHQ